MVVAGDDRIVGGDDRCLVEIGKVRVGTFLGNESTLEPISRSSIGKAICPKVRRRQTRSSSLSHSPTFSQFLIVRFQFTHSYLLHLYSR